MAYALSSLRKDVRLVKLGNERHDLERTATRVRMLRELEGFLAVHLGLE